MRQNEREVDFKFISADEHSDIAKHIKVMYKGEDVSKHIPGIEIRFVVNDTDQPQFIKDCLACIENVDKYKLAKAKELVKDIQNKGETYD